MRLCLPDLGRGRNRVVFAGRLIGGGAAGFVVCTCPVSQRRVHAKHPWHPAQNESENPSKLIL